jgi:maltose-binding protein MalE
MRTSDWWLFRGAQLESLQVQLFAEGRLAAMVARPRVIPTLELLGAPMAVIPTPPLDPGDEPVRQVVAYQCLVVSAGSPWVDLAFRLGARMIDEETQHRLNQISRQLPVLAASYRLRPAITSPGLLGFLRAMEKGITYPMATEWDRDIADLHDALEREIAGRHRRVTPTGGSR